MVRSEKETQGGPNTQSSPLTFSVVGFLSFGLRVGRAKNAKYLISEYLWQMKKWHTEVKNATDGKSSCFELW